MATESGTQDLDVIAESSTRGTSRRYRYRQPPTLRRSGMRSSTSPSASISSRRCGCSERLMPDREPSDVFVNPSREVVHFGAHSIYFVSTEPALLACVRKYGEPARMTVNFMGLIGPLGVLPQYYTELVISRGRAKDNAIRDFFDIFNHRMISLFFQAWQKYRFTVAYERGERDRFSHHLLDLIGLGTEGLQNRQSVADDSLIYYAGLLAQQPRSAVCVTPGYWRLFPISGRDRTVRRRLVQARQGNAVQFRRRTQPVGTGGARSGGGR